MKLIFLNCWSGKLAEPLAAFLAGHKNTADVFCFQEANGNMPAICKEVLPEYQQVRGYKYVSEYDEFPMLVCVQPEIEVIASGTVLQDTEKTGLGVYARLQKDGEETIILNAHGVSRPGDKLDTPERLKQSAGFIEFMERQPDTKIIGGDFNLLPETESVKMFEQRRYRNLVKDFNIPSTRNRLVWEKFPNNKQLHSNYVFVEQGIEVKSFMAENIEVSDHLPLILEL